MAELGMTAEQVVKLEIIKRAAKKNGILVFKDEYTPETIDELYDDALTGEYSDEVNEEYYNIRHDGEEINLPATCTSRHYEVDTHVLNIDDKWITFDYYYGGGKHSEHDSIDWLDTCRFVDCEEKVVTKTIRTFKELEK